MTTSLRPPGLPDYASITPSGIDAAASRALEAASEIVEATIAEARGGAVLDGISDAVRILWAVYGEGEFLALVHPDAAIREAANAATERMEAWRASLMQRPELLARLESLDAGELDPQQAAVRQRWIARMRVAGAHLDAVSRERLGAHIARVAALSAAFMANQTADRPTVDVDVDRLAGLPADALASLAEGEAPGTVRVPVELRPLILEHVRDRGVRQQLHRLWLGQASANAKVLAEMVAERRAMAELLGAESWAAVRASVGMAGDVGTVRHFLEALEPPFLAALERQLESARFFVAAEAGEPLDGFVLQDWDTLRGLALLREQGGVDQAALRRHLPLPGVLAGLARVVERTFGVRVVPVEGEFGWHPEVRRLDLVDVASGAALGTLLLDPFARDGKMPGPAGLCSPLALGVPAGEGTRPLSHAALVTYFPPVAEGGIYYLTPNDVISLFHELGHALDFILGSTRYAPIDGNEWIADWSEAPSQSIGYWALLPDVLVELSSPDETGERLSIEAARAFAAASRAGSAIENARLLWGGVLDQRIHGTEVVDLDEAWRAAWPLRRTPLAWDRFATAPLFFLGLGYDAVTYGFMWSQVYLDEILARFAAEGGLSPEVGRAYRTELLEPGWAPDPLERMRRFLGREPSMDALLRRLDG